MSNTITDIRPRLRVPATAAPGQTLTLRTLANHPMFSGLSTDADGAVIERHTLTRFACHFGDEIVFEADLTTGFSANPFLEFDVVATRSGTFHFRWEDDRGQVFTAEADITVS